jgi:DNA polymerase-3 subunit delta'
MSWHSVVGQEQGKEILRNALRSGRIAHAYLFAGPEGSGIEPIAMEFAKALLCERASGDACDKCPSCLKAAAFQHANIHCITALPVGKGEKSGDAPLAKLSEEEIGVVREQLAFKSANPYFPISMPRATTIKVNSIREIRKEVSMTAFGKGRKVFLVLGAEAMNDEASNALLKTLEEPPPDTILLLTAEHPEQLLPTILSRCQLLRLGPLPRNEIAEALRRSGDRSAEEAETIAGLAEGSYTRALQLLDSDYREQRDESVSFLRSSLKGAPGELSRLVERWHTEYEKGEIADCLRMLQIWLRSAMLAQTAGAVEALHADETLQKFASHYRSVSYRDVDGSLERAISLIEKNVYIPLILLTLAASLRRSVGNTVSR